MRAGRMANSVTCCALRTVKTMPSTVACEMSGLSQRKNGAIRREECWPDLESAEAEKINAIQMMTGSQYLAKERSQGTADENKLDRAVAMKFQNERLSARSGVSAERRCFTPLFAALS